MGLQPLPEWVQQTDVSTECGHHILPTSCSVPLAWQAHLVLSAQRLHKLEQGVPFSPHELSGSHQLAHTLAAPLATVNLQPVVLGGVKRKSLTQQVRQSEGEGATCSSWLRHKHSTTLTHCQASPWLDVQGSQCHTHPAVTQSLTSLTNRSLSRCRRAFSALMRSNSS